MSKVIIANLNESSHLHVLTPEESSNVFGGVVDFGGGGGGGGSPEPGAPLLAPALAVIGCGIGWFTGGLFGCAKGAYDGWDLGDTISDARKKKP